MFMRRSKFEKQSLEVKAKGSKIGDVKFTETPSFFLETFPLPLPFPSIMISKSRDLLLGCDLNQMKWK